MRHQIRPKARLLFQNVTSYVPATTDENALDVVLVDEAHRIENFTIDRYRPERSETGMPQVDTIIRATKISVFFIDDRQVEKLVQQN